MVDKPFRVLLDVRDLQLQRLKYVWISVSPRETRNIADLKSAIISKINLASKEIKLSVREGILLDEETIAVLREDDTVRVEVEYGGEFTVMQDNGQNRNTVDKDITRSNDSTPKTNFSKREKQKNKFVYDDISGKGRELEDDNFSKSKKQKIKSLYDDISGKGTEFEEMSCDQSVSEDVSLEVKKNKNVVTSFDDKYEKVHKQKKKTSLLPHEQDYNMKTQNLDKSAERAVSISVEMGSDIIQQPKRKKSEKSKKVNGYSDLITNINNECLSSQIRSTENKLIHSFVSEMPVMEDVEKSSKNTTNNSPKKKRKRKRKCTNSLYEAIVPLDLSYADVPSPICPPNPMRKHIIYESENPYMETPAVESTEFITISSENSNDNFDDSAMKKSLSSAEVSAPVQRNDDLLLDDCDATVIRNEQAISPNLKKVPVKVASVIGENITDDGSAAKKVSENLQTCTYSKYDNLPSLTCQPEVGTKIAYKILELDDNYSPIVSEVREGVVKEINCKTEEMTIELLKHIIKPGRVGKFEVLKEDEIPLPAIIKEETVWWNNLIEPKLLV